MSGIRRRDFVILLGGGAAAAWPLAARAQQPAMPVIGFLSGRSPGESANLLAAFRLGLGETGYVEGKNLAVEYRWAEGRLDQLPTLAADLARQQVAVIAAVTTPGALAAKAATSIVPVVFVAGGDPVDLGLVTGLSRPGGNVTGVSLITFELLRKRIQLICEIVPKVSTIGLLVNSTNTTADFSRREAQEVARALDRQIVMINASRETEFEEAFASLVDRQAGALVISPDPFFNGHSEELGALAARHGIPTIAEVREFAAAGGLLSYGTSFVAAYRQAGIYIGRILKGAKPSDLPVMQATTVHLVINLKTARTLGLEIPLPLLGRADEVIE
jgi:putative tryptophan/tyrosine transport system substrate-binding protein